jgi:hypothetical protein
MKYVLPAMVVAMLLASPAFAAGSMSKIPAPEKAKIEKECKELNKADHAAYKACVKDKIAEALAPKK